MVEWLEARTRNLETPGSSALCNHWLDLFRASPLCKSSATLCKWPTGKPPCQLRFLKSFCNVINVSLITLPPKRLALNIIVYKLNLLV